MKMLRVKPFLAAALVAALVVALPASASASEWLKNGAPLKSGESTIAIEGQFKRVFYQQLSTVQCPVNAEIKVVPKSHYEAITKFSVDPERCEGIGNYVECRVESFSSSTPWPVHIAGTESEPTIVANEASFTWNFKKNQGSCPAVFPWTFSGPLTLKPKTPGSISTVDVVADEPANPFNNYYTGTSWPVSPSGVYGIKL